MPEIPRPINQTCSCGATLLWECRESQHGKRWLALCGNPECGLITTRPEGVEHPENCLQSFLLGDAPIRRNLKPWVRLFFKASQLGYRWCPGHEPCPSCKHEATAALRIPWHPARAGDPFYLALCLQCGATTTFSWVNGERLVLSLDGAAWERPTAELQALRQTLLERAGPAEEFGEAA
jgi:hypothetical protein